MKLYDELKYRGLIAQTSNEEVVSKQINEGKATFYIGYDPTADSLHVGHFLTLTLMRRLQLAGNRPIALLGGGTGYIGDPSGKSDLRKILTPEEIAHNCECFKKQISKFIDFSDGKALCVNNADWLLPLNYIDVLRDVGACFSVNNMLRAKCYELRMEKGLSFLELNYMIMQAYDFYHLFKEYNCSLQFGGDDQWSNMLAGTELIRKKLGKDANVLTFTLLTTSEGHKMGKTEKGAIWIDANKTSPYEFYQYWRNIDDADVIKSMKMLSFIPVEEIMKMEKWDASRINELKEILAYSLTELVHGKEAAEQSQNTARALFSGDAFNVDMPHTKFDETILHHDRASLLDILVLTGLASSKGEARRLIEQGGISIDNEKVNDINAVIYRQDLTKSLIIKKGKKIFHKVSL